MIINQSYEVILAFTDEADALEREYGEGLARLLIHSSWLATDFAQGFCISNDEGLCEVEGRNPCILLADDQPAVEDTLVRQFEFRFEPTPELVLKRDLLETAFARAEDPDGPLLFVTEPVTITDPYTKEFIELSLIVSVSWRDPDAYRLRSR